MKNTFKIPNIIYLFVIALSAIVLSLKGQKSIDYNTLLLNLNMDTIQYGNLPEDTKPVYIVRNQTSDFFRSQLNLAEPSSISSKFFAIDKTYNSDTSLQKKDFLLNANIQIPIGLGGPRWNIRKLGLISTLQIIPQFKVRIFDNDISRGDSSLPVRTPSYMPRITYFGTHKSLWKVKQFSHYWGFSTFHHSNGQDGNEFNDEGKINIYNGNFGENLVFDIVYGGLYSSKPTTNKRKNKGIHAKKRRPNKMIYCYDKVIHDIYWKITYEIHTKNLTNKAFEQLNLYGRKRLNFQLGYIKSPIYVTKVFSNDNPNGWHNITNPEIKELFRLLLNINYIADKNYVNGDFNTAESISYLNLGKRMNIYLTAYWRIRGTPYSALFLQAGYWGTDNYNIYFQQSLWHIRAGLALSFFKYPTN